MIPASRTPPPDMKIFATIEKMVHGGLGLSRTEKGVVFVSGALPGETVLAVIDAHAGGQAHASMLEIVKPSPFRRKPGCTYAGVCGGCDWLHIEYKAQVSMKTDIFRECLQRIGKMNDLPAIDVIESPEYAYRRRVQIKLDRAGNTAGFFKRRSSEVVSVSHCPVLCAELDNLLSELPLKTASLPAGCSQVKAICGTRGCDGEPSSSLVASSPVLQGCAKRSLIETELGRFVVDGDCFFQSNRFLAGTMGGRWTCELTGETVWDLYAGTGFFSVFLGHRFAKGILVDSDRGNIAAARQNLDINGINHIQTRHDSAEHFLDTEKKSAVRPDCVIVDPPREGLRQEVREHLASLGSPALLYVSCDPATQARDAGFLVRSGYHIEAAALFDCYPQTHHLETILLLKR